MRRLLAACLFPLAISGAFAQNEPVKDALPSQANTTGTAFSLQEAVNYALQNNVNVTNAQLDIESAKARVGEIRAVGLPQISAQGNITDNVKIPTSFLPAVFFDSKASPDAPPVPVQFGVQYSGSVGISASQLLFDGSYFVGLKAAATYNELSRKNLTQSKIDVSQSVMKAYYSVLVNQESLALLDYNVKRLDTLYQQTKIQFTNGFVEQIDVDRIEVQYNNLKIDLERTARVVELSKHLLKFQMGYQVAKPIELTDKLALNNVENMILSPETGFNYNQRIEYSILQTQKDLTLLNIRNYRMGYYPQLVALGSYGYNRGSNKFDLFRSPWFNNASIGINLSIPIFDGLSKHYKIQQAKIAYKQVVESSKLIENSIDLEIRAANTSLANSLDALKTQRRNLELAQRVAQVTKVKYQQGVGSNIEVINAESLLRSAQTNYYTALYDALISKVDADRATGKLAAE